MVLGKQQCDWVKLNAIFDHFDADRNRLLSRAEFARYDAPEERVPSCVTRASR